MSRLLRLIAVTILLLPAACHRPVAESGPGGWTADTKGRNGLGTVPATDLGFVRHADAVDWPSASDWVPPGDGLRAMLPAADCVLALGDYLNGHRAVTANWTGPQACDRLQLDPAPDGRQGNGDGPPDQVNGWPGGGINADAALVTPEGSILAAASDGLTRYRDGQREQLARADLSTAGFEGNGTRSLVRGLVRTRSGRIVVNADLTTSAGPPPAVLVSADGRKSLRRVDLPAADGPAPGSRQLLAVMAAEGDTVVAIGYGWGTVGVWRSVDGGRRWTVSSVDGLPPQLVLTRLVRAGERWLAFGAVDRTETGEQDIPYVLSSADGVTWKPVPTAGMGAGRVADVTVDRSGTVVVVGAVDDSRPYVEGRRDDYCGVVWLGDGTGGWQRGELGCSDSPPQAVTTLHDGRVLIAGNRDLWLRAAA
ncbi:glycoside hydrolase [Actinoplanes sp. NBC_00393]|uniref:sialidase family protein n=1 Tax=Actinoplanes sp. NBC_00393 TaxID=2975953 RepID=UPI002E239F30